MGQIGKTENRIEYQIRKPVNIAENPQTAATAKPKNRSFFGTKTEKPIKKIAKTAKPKIPMPLSTNKMPAPQAMLSQKSLFCGQNSLSIQRRC